MNPLLRFLVLVACVPVGACCTTPARSLADLKNSDYPGVLRAPESLGAAGQWQQVVTASWEGGERSFEAILMQKDDLLRVLGPSPVGGVAFVFDLRGDETNFDNRTGERIPFPPRFILLDVQRAFYPWLGPRPADGARFGEVDGESITELWRDGKLVERSFKRLDDKPLGIIHVRYEWDNPDWFLPTRAVLTNGWFGYGLAVKTSSEHLLEGDRP